MHEYIHSVNGKFAIKFSLSVREHQPYNIHVHVAHTCVYIRTRQATRIHICNICR